MAELLEILFSPAVLKVVQVLLFILIGLGFRGIRLFGDREGEVLRRFVVQFTVPVMVFFSMYDASRDAVSALPTMAGALVLITAALFLLGWPCSHVVKDGSQRAAVHACVTLGNYGWLGWGVCQVLLGEGGLRCAVFFTVLWWPVFYLFGLPIGVIHGRVRKGAVPIGRAVAVAAPVIGMVILGLIFNFRGWKVPQLLSDTLRPFGNMTVPLILFSVGAMLDFKTFRKALAPAVLVSAVTLVGGALIGWGVASLLTHDPTSYKTIIVEGAMPVATLTLVLAENYDVDVDMINTCIVVSTVLSMVTLPILAALVVG